MWPRQKANLRNPTLLYPCLPYLGLDRLHIGIREAEMVADFVNQDVTDDMAQRFLVFGPVIEDRAAVQPDQVGQAGDVVIAAERQAYALEQAEQIEFALRLHLV